jgi:hypothetical protein
MAETDSKGNLPIAGQSLYTVKNFKTREYLSIWALDRNDAINKLEWQGEVKWVMWLKGYKLQVTETDYKRPVEKVKSKEPKTSLKIELNTIDKTLNKDDSIRIIKGIVKRRRQAAGKSIDKSKIDRLSTNYYYMYVAKKKPK